MKKMYLLLMGCLIVVLGIAALVMANGSFGLTHGNGWPLYLVVLGLFSSIAAFVAKDVVARILFGVFGALLLLFGGFFLLFSLEAMSWEEVDTLWPLIPVIVGISQFFAYVVGYNEVKPLLFTSIGLIAGGLIVLTYLRMGASPIIDKLWPLFIIVVGVVVIARQGVKK